MVFEFLNKLAFLIVQSFFAAVSASYYQKEFSGYLFTTFPYYNSEWRNQYDAQNWCNQNGSKLLAITNSSIQNAAVAFINDARQQNQLSENNIISDGRRTSDAFKWINETSSSLLSIEGQNGGLALSYVYMYTTSTGLTLWADLPTDPNYYICEFAGQTSCRNGYQYGGQCFQSFSEAVTWFEARNRCLMKGGDLATFEFITTNDGLNSLNGSWINPSTKYWIGLRRQWWKWQSINSEVAYSQWANDQPAYYKPDDNFDCLCLGPNDWKWKDCSCTDPAQIVCIRASSSSGTVSTTTPASLLSTINQRHSVSVSSTNAQYSTPNASGVNRVLAIGLGAGLGGGFLLLTALIIIVIILLSRKGCFRRNDTENNVKSAPPSPYESIQNGTTGHDINNPASTYQELNIIK